MIIPSNEIAGFDFETVDPFIGNTAREKNPKNKIRMGAGWVFDDFKIIGCAITEGDAEPYWTEDMDVVRDVCKRFKYLRGFNSANYEFGILQHKLGISLAKHTLLDTRIAAYLYRSNLPKFSLDYLAKKYLKKEKSDQYFGQIVLDLGLYKKQVVNDNYPFERFKGRKFGTSPKKSKRETEEKYWKRLVGVAKENLHVIYKHDPQTVINYALDDVRLDRELWNLFAPELDYWDWEEESDFIKAMLFQRSVGLNVNVERAIELYAASELRIKELTKEFEEKFGKMPNLRSTKQLKEYFHAKGIKGLLNKKGTAESFDKNFTKYYKNTVPECAIIEEIRKEMHNLSYLDYIFEYMALNGGRNKIHSETNAYGARTGRMSMKNPNMQNPNKKNGVREIFYMPDGFFWGKIDYSSQEPRLQVHFAARSMCSGAMSLVNGFIENPDFDVHGYVCSIVWPDKWAEAKTKEEIKKVRDPAKIVNLGKSYGMGIVKFAYNLGTIKTLSYEILLVLKQLEKIPYLEDKIEYVMNSLLPEEYKQEFEKGILEAIEVRKKYDEFMPYLAELTQKASDLVRKRGFLICLSGRRVYIDEFHKALNALIQGSAFDMLKKAIVACWRAKKPALLWVHDELGVPVRDVAELNEVKKIMCSCVQLEVPVAGEAEIGPSWGKLEKAA